MLQFPLVTVIWSAGQANDRQWRNCSSHSSRHSAHSRRETGKLGNGKAARGGWGIGGMGGAQLSGSAAKLITMMDYNTLYRCPLPARLSCWRGSFATSVCVSTTMWQAQAAAATTAALGPSASLNPSHVLTIYAVLSYLLWELSSKRGSEINLTA